MYKYKFVTIEIDNWGKIKTPTQEIIRKHAAIGWRFVQITDKGYLSTKWGVSQQVIIFEMPMDAKPNAKEYGYYNDDELI